MQSGQSSNDVLQALRERWGSIVTEKPEEQRRRVAEAMVTSPGTAL
ncbi:MAG: hypothetical protein K2G24_05495 [Muribaculaceae bacterium]|nr:hypothetical protein [Muribaculaceae bacterium]